MKKFPPRTRVVRARLVPGRDGIACGAIGQVGTIVDYPHEMNCVRWDVTPRITFRDDLTLVYPDSLEPLLSPGTDEWAREKVKKFTKPEPVSPALPTIERKENAEH